MSARRAALLLLLAGAASCARGPRSYVLVHSTGHTLIGATSFHIIATVNSQVGTTDVGDLRSLDPFSFSISFSPDHTGAATIRVVAMQGATQVGVDEKATTLVPGGTSVIDVSFGPTPSDMPSADLAVPDGAPPADQTVPPVDQTVPPVDQTVPPVDLVVPFDFSLLPMPDMPQPLGDMMPPCSALLGNGTMPPSAATVMPNNPKFDITNTPIVVEAWVKLINLSTSGTMIVDHGGMQLRGYMLSIDPMGHAVFQLFTTAMTSPYTVIGNTVIPTGTWTEIAGQYEPLGPTISIWVDGKLQMSAIIQGTPNYLSAPLVVGGNLDGWVDEIRISSVIRFTPPGPTLVSNRFSGDPGTVGLYHFDELMGPVAADSSINPKPLMIMNGGSLSAASCRP